ncbi:hypothetical protein ACFVUS_12690 [Nocardia sp. NPDC058058]|uniref:hypothetical protein n=1 Tax=Nocardia sp. NPDC058058 TaxID=3346317 RepID=UPI0036DE66FA
MSEYSNDYFGDYREKEPSRTAHAVLTRLGEISVPNVGETQRQSVRKLVASKDLPLEARVELLRMLGLVP